MKRGGPLKRGEGLSRATPLQQRSALKRHVALNGGVALKSHKKSQTDTQLAGEFFGVIARRGVKCLVCGSQAGIDPHHALDKAFIRRSLRATLGVQETERWAWDLRDGLPLCRACHTAVEMRSYKIPRHLIPLRVWEFAEEIDSILGTRAATMRLEMMYP